MADGTTTSLTEHFVSARLTETLQWPHGTSVMRASRSATRQTSQQSSLTAAVSCAVALTLAQTAVDWSKLISYYLRRQVTISFPYFVVPALSSLVFSFPPLSHGATFSSLAFSVLAFSAPPIRHCPVPPMKVVFFPRFVCQSSGLLISFRWIVVKFLEKVDFKHYGLHFEIDKDPHPELIDYNF